ncbi:MAG: response regulator [Alphaproteobacteria bacterium]|nr:response regulator [Alphaproteobacteria bacterium]MCB9793485.1 response regulator [Alphaproteobacteria bacterium]
MSRPRIGEVMVDLELLTRDQVSEVLAALREREKGRFGELALEMGLIDEAGLAQAVAEQFRLRMVPDDRVARLSVSEAVVALLPRELITQHGVVPTFYDPEKQVLSLLVVDPTDVPALRQAKELSQAQMLRLFVGTRSAVQALIARVLPAPSQVEAPSGPTPPALAPLSTPTILETNLPLLTALRRVAELEGDRVELVSDPDAVTALVESGASDRVIMRSAVAPQAEPYLGAWRRARPALSVTRVSGFSPGQVPVVSYSSARDFFLGMLEFTLLAGERTQVGLRAQIRRLSALSRGLAAELELAPEVQDAVAIAALFYHAEKLSAFERLKEEGGVRGRFSTALSMLAPHRPPFPVEPLFEALELRMSGGLEPGDRLDADAIFTAARAQAAGIGGRVDAADILDREAGHHDPRVIAALSRVLRKEQLRAQLDEGGEAAASRVLVAERDPDTVTALEARLGQAGFVVEVVADGESALEVAQSRTPDALIANMRLPQRDGLSLLMTLKRSPATAELPVLLLTDRAGPADRARGLEVGAEDVLEKPVNGAVLLALLRRSIRPKSSAAAVSGRLSELALADLVQTLSLGGRTAEIRITAGTELGSVGMAAGELRTAGFGSQIGNEALWALMALPEGRFAVQFGVEPGTPNLRGQTDFLLLEGLRRLDEGRR